MSSEEKITVKLAPESPEERARMLAAIQGGPHAEKAAAAPLPIWFYVGLVLLLFGSVLGVSGAASALRPGTLPGAAALLGWGGGMAVAGGALAFAGLRARRGR